MAQNNRLTSETGFVSKAQRKNSAFSGKRTPHGAQKPQNCKKIPENPKFRRKTVAKAVDNII